MSMEKIIAVVYGFRTKRNEYISYQKDEAQADRLCINKCDWERDPKLAWLSDGAIGKYDYIGIPLGDIDGWSEESISFYPQDLAQLNAKLYQLLTEENIKIPYTEKPKLWVAVQLF